MLGDEGQLQTSPRTPHVGSCWSNRGQEVVGQNPGKLGIFEVGIKGDRTSLSLFPLLEGTPKSLCLAHSTYSINGVVPGKERWLSLQGTGTQYKAARVNTACL